MNFFNNSYSDSQSNEIQKFVGAQSFAPLPCTSTGNAIFQFTEGFLPKKNLYLLILVAIAVV
ncbi:hypothetical protein A6S26_25795 [Nostoc sp. ATCC 43529]|nr:hypothetical protein A6S26_25795 [Nostoc sp. ATCC 43529]